jgi:uncharacterized protein (DUF983 family)
MTDAKHCPGFEQNKSLKTFLCKCPECGAEVEVFSDELDRKRTCSGCGNEIDVNQCVVDAGA